MTTRAPSAAPLNHLKVWADSHTLFVEIPGAVISYPFSEGGLSKAIALIRTTSFDFGGTPVASPGKLQSKSSALAESILRRHGIIR